MGSGGGVSEWVPGTWSKREIAGRGELLPKLSVSKKPSNIKKTGRKNFVGGGRDNEITREAWRGGVGESVLGFKPRSLGKKHPQTAN